MRRTPVRNSLVVTILGPALTVMPAAALTAAFSPAPAASQTPALTVRLAHESEAERATRDHLLALAERHDLSPWVHTTEVLIDEDQIPHSHPVLTLHTRHLGDDDGLLATFLHEQLHWFALERDDATERAKDRFRELFPEVPAASEGGARDAESTWLHLVVCDLELAATAAVIGEDAARAVLGANTHYQWIYRQVLENPVVREVNTEVGLHR
jgi:hypothetical protein